MKYIDLTKPHAYLIWKGKQKAIISPDLLVTGEKMLVTQEGKEAFGEVVLGYPAQINLTEFERLELEHAIRPEERKLKWPNLDKFYLYRFKEWEPFIDTRDVEINNGDAELLPLPELTAEEQKLIEQAERLPKTLILKDEAVTLEDGQVIFCEGLDGSKVMPILQATLEDKAIQDSLPLYQLALVRIPRLKLKKNLEEVSMELEEEKAEGTKPYKVVKNHPGCKEGKPYGVINTETDELKGCSDNEEMANAHMGALYAAEKEEKAVPGSGGRDKPKKTSSSGGRKPKRSKKELAQALVEALVEEDDEETKENNFNLTVNVSQEEEKALAEAEKEQSLDSKVSAIREGFYKQFDPPKQVPNQPEYKPRPWIREIYPDYAIVGNGNKLYKVSYSIDENGQPKFADKSKWAEMEVQLIPTGNMGAKGILEGYDESAKSFSEWVTDYYEFADKSITDLSPEDAIKAMWSTAFVNNLPNDSFLYIKPNCGENDADGKMKPRSCRMFPVKDASGKVDMPHLRNAIARAPQSNLSPEIQTKIQKQAQRMLSEENKEEDEKAGRRVKKTMMEKVKKAWETLKEFMDWATPEEDDEEETGMMSMFGGKSSIGIKKVGDEYWYVSWSANAFQDREKEIFSTKSLESYVAEAEKKEDRGYFNLWHIGTKAQPDLTDFAEKKWQGVIGRFLVEAGPFLNTPKGKAAFKFFKQYANGHPDLAPEGWGCSVEYRYLPEERKTGVYKNVWITRTSTLPKLAAANIWTQGGITMALTKEQQKAAELIFGEELTKDIIKVAEDKTKELEEAGVAHKGDTSTEEKEPKVEEVKEVPAEDVIVQQIAAKLETDWEPVTKLMTTLVEGQKNLESKIAQLESQLSEKKVEETQKAKDESPKYVWSLVQRASEAEKTIVADGDPLKGMKPQEAVKSDKSGAANFFGK